MAFWAQVCILLHFDEQTLSQTVENAGADSKHRGKAEQ